MAGGSKSAIFRSTEEHRSRVIPGGEFLPFQPHSGQGGGTTQWSPTRKPSFHEPARFGDIQFEGTQANVVTPDGKVNGKVSTAGVHEIWVSYAPVVYQIC